MPVPDPRLDVLSKIAGSKALIPTHVKFVDIAGLVKGASKGEGLGNKFLGHIREVDAIAYVLRCFEDENITHVESTINPLYDAEIIETELVIADIATLEKRMTNAVKRLKNDKTAAQEIAEIEVIIKCLNDGKPATEACKYSISHDALSQYQLLTSKPRMYICNVDESSVLCGNKFSDAVMKFAKERGDAVILISAKIESELAIMDSAGSRAEFLEMLGLKETGLNKLIMTGYSILGLQTYFTVGPKEAHAWTVKRGCLAPDAAEVIHTDFKRGFIKAEVIGYDDYVRYEGETGARNAGKLRIEGKEYVVNEGDIIHFKFNV